MTLTPREEDAGLRLDQYLARELPDTSRARLQEWIKAGQVRLNGRAAKPSTRLHGGERIELPDTGREPRSPLHAAHPEPIPLEILYEDETLVAIHKPAGMTVHAGAGRREGTLVNALLHHFRQLSQVGGEARPGIVHRLDRLTSGVLLVAKTDAAHLRLAEQFARRQVRKTYWALVHGNFSVAGRRKWGRPVVENGVAWTRLEMPIRRDRRHRVKMTARARAGRTAVSDFRVLEDWPGFSLLEVRISTGRTHQIRVHLSAAGHPVVGDTLYGAPAQPALPRYFLHAREIIFSHPADGRPITVRAALPPELEAHLSHLRAGRSELVLL
ncbi:MAG: RluA family pseudouridine synthase [Acidobacteria bacterium]|nr:RluA family pseudouridine synthase [Acidobacteriota bacterium]